jgi:RimJ/RimL family protein N-acetyltransferase
VDHAKTLYPLLAGTAVCDTLVWDGPESLESFLATYVDQPGEPSHRHYTILGGGVPVGALSIRPGFQHGRGDIGYWVGIPFQGKGYATAAVAEALRIAFTDMGMEKVEACAFLGNLGSRRVLEKNGFVQEGLTRKAVLKRGRWLDEWVFGITREEWRSR